MIEKKGQIVHGFEILDIVDLSEINAVGVYARHTKSGAEAFHVLNDDEENLFAFSFATAPEDSTGVTHIIEHSVLCGSERYPLKDTFLALGQGSLQTYLNAWTFPDKTVYPASSVNERDYFNIMGVYADAVFHPLLSEWTFMQEGHRLEFIDDDGASGASGASGARKLSVTGVVYNEMKGAYSSVETIAERLTGQTLLEGTPYAYESGGDPECIPDLTFDYFKAFHKKRYSPANCKIFLAGNIASEKQFAFLDAMLSATPAGDVAPPLPLAERWEKPRRVRARCPADGGKKATVLLSWLCGDAADPDETMALIILSEILMGHEGSPLTKSLVESELGEDISPVSGFENERRQTVMTVGLRGVDYTKTSAEDVERFIMEELRRLARDGIPKEEIEAAIVSLEFFNREIRRAHGPFSLVWLQRALRGWLHGKKPWESLLFLPPFTAIKEKLAQSGRGGESGRFFETLIETYLLDNPHRVLLSLEPDDEYFEKKEAALAQKLAEKQAALSEAKLRDIEKKAETLEIMQGEKESPEALATIPHLSVRDLSPEIITTPRVFFDAGGTPVLAHELFTNGITYANIAFPADILEPEDYPWLSLFSRAATAAGLPGMDYAAVSSLLARTIGDFSLMPQSFGVSTGSSRSIALPSGIFDIRGRDWLIWNFSCLDEKMAPGSALIFDLITKADFTDMRRLNDIVLNYRNNAVSSIAPFGHEYAASRAGRHFSKQQTRKELWNGISQLEFIQKVTALDTAEISKNLIRIRDALAAAGALIHITASKEAIDAALPLFERTYFGAPKPRKTGTPEHAFLSLCSEKLEESQTRRAAPCSPDAGRIYAPEVWASPALQVGFASTVIPAAEYATRDYTAELLLAHYAATGALWETIRMKGGAYGAFAYHNGIDRGFCLASYRDPEPLKTLTAFYESLTKIGGGGIDGGSMEKAIIGAYARETRPQTPKEKGAIDYFRFLCGIEDVQRSRIRRHLLDMTADDVTAAAWRLAGRMNTDSASCVLEGAGGANSGAERTAAALGVTACALPIYIEE
ncbi:MAG: insulinase family protein [Treponema sp.]|jgi:Zn-dependent M16 (insulinase) family peptidase|nr:insulinase family protein [Treponema sp.]